MRGQIIRADGRSRASMRKDTHEMRRRKNGQQDARRTVGIEGGVNLI